MLAGEMIVRIGADMGPLQRKIEAAGKTIQSFGRNLESAGTTLSKTITLPATIAAGAFSLLTLSAASAGDELAKLSQKLGISVETLSGYRLSADLANVSLQDLGQGLSILSRKMFDAASGSEEAQAVFDMLGIKVVGLDGKLRSSNDVLLDVAKIFSQLPDGTAKTALAMELFGRSGAQLIPLLNQGAEALRRQQEEAKALGVAWSGPGASAAEAFRDSLTRLRSALSGLFLRFAGAESAGELFNQLNAWVTTLTTTISQSKGIQAMIDWVKGLKEAFFSLNPVIQLAIVGFGVFLATIGPVLTVIGFMVSNIGVLVPLLYGAGVALVGFFVSPLGAALAFATAGYLVYRNWEAAKNFFMSSFIPALKAVGDFFKNLVLVIASGFLTLPRIILEAVEKIFGIVSYALSLIPKIGETLAAPFKMAEGAVASLGDKISAFQTERLDALIDSGDKIGGGVKDIFGDVKDYIGGLLSSFKLEAPKIEAPRVPNLDFRPSGVETSAGAAASAATGTPMIIPFTKEIFNFPNAQDGGKPKPVNDKEGVGRLEAIHQTLLKIEQNTRYKLDLVTSDANDRNQW